MSAEAERRRAEFLDHARQSAAFWSEMDWTAYAAERREYISADDEDQGVTRRESGVLTGQAALAQQIRHGPRVGDDFRGGGRDVRSELPEGAGKSVSGVSIRRVYERDLDARAADQFASWAEDQGSALAGDNARRRTPVTGPGSRPIAGYTAGYGAA